MTRLIALKTLDCGCRIIWNCSANEDNIEFCRLHGAAPKLLNACQQMLSAWDDYEMLAALDINVHRQAIDAIRMTEGEKTE